jgi:hypothetical protein
MDTNAFKIFLILLTTCDQKVESKSRKQFGQSKVFEEIILRFLFRK